MLISSEIASQTHSELWSKHIICTYGNVSLLWSSRLLPMCVTYLTSSARKEGTCFINTEVSVRPIVWYTSEKWTNDEYLHNHLRLSTLVISALVWHLSCGHYNSFQIWILWLYSLSHPTYLKSSLIFIYSCPYAFCLNSIELAISLGIYLNISCLFYLNQDIFFSRNAYSFFFIFKFLPSYCSANGTDLPVIIFWSPRLY
jgi:hypothetical protein